MKVFSDEMEKYGHTYAFAGRGSHGAIEKAPAFIDESDSGETKPVLDVREEFDVRRENDIEELLDILHSPGGLPLARRPRIKDWLRVVYRSNRGFELGTFNPSLLATCMKQQSSQWADISMGFVSDIIVIVHGFIASALASICPDREVCEALTSKLAEGITQRYRKAMVKTQFLLEVEQSDVPFTLNHYFNDNLQKR